MAYSTQVGSKARERLAQAKADRESENRRHLIDAYRRVPRLKEIDLEFQGTMAKAAQAVFTQGGDVQVAMEQVRNENLALQLERRELIAANFEEGYLDESPICDRCGGYGYVGSTMCECPVAKKHSANSGWIITVIGMIRSTAPVHGPLWKRTSRTAALMLPHSP